MAGGEVGGAAAATADDPAAAAAGDPAAASWWSDKVVHKYREIREHAETYPYVWASYILVYGGFGGYLAWRWRKLRRTEDRVRVLQDRLRKLVAEEESAAAAAGSTTAATPATPHPPRPADKPGR